MKRIALWAVLAVPCVLLAAEKRIPAGSRIYVEAADGFDTYLTAALQKKKVPVTVTSDKEKADFYLDGVSDHNKPGWASTVFLGKVHSDDQASIRLIDK